MKLQGPLLADLARGRDNHFNLLRFLAAAGVIWSHSFPIAFGPGTPEPLEYLLKGDNLGRLCVFVFFIVSGFFISASFDRAANLRDYAVARLLRIWPGLAVMLAIMLTLVGLFSATPGARLDWAWREAADALLMVTDFTTRLPPEPVVFAQNPLAGAFNGSLWTLRHEVFAYIGVALIGSLGLLRKPLAAAALLIAAIAGYYAVPMATGRSWIVAFSYVGLPFAFGAFFYVWRARIVMHGALVLALALPAILLWPTPFFFPVFIAWLSYTVIWLGHLPLAPLKGFNRFGDYSYGIYIYAFPIQQLLVQSGVISPGPQSLVAFILSLCAAILSWRYVEQPALKLRLKLKSR